MLPKVLQLQLKRFAYSQTDGSLGLVKLGDKLTFSQDLDLESFVALEVADDDNVFGADVAATRGSCRPPARYKLHAVLIHKGNALRGHYYAFVRPNLGGGGEGGWVRYNDEAVTPVSWETVSYEGFGGGGDGVQSTNAYLLQYVREDVIPALRASYTTRSTAWT